MGWCVAVFCWLGLRIGCFGLGSAVGSTARVGC